MKKILLSFLLSLPLGAKLNAHPMDQYIGCYQAVTINGEAPGTHSDAQSKIFFDANTEGKVFADPTSNKGIPYYKVMINSGYLVPDSGTDPIYYWTNVFTDRGNLTKTATADAYFFNDQINFFPALPDAKNYIWWLYSKIDISKANDQVNVHLVENLTATMYDPSQDGDPAFDVVAVLKSVDCK